MRFALPHVSTRRLVGTVAVLAALLRFPGMLWPIRPDEAGFTLVARAWHPEPDSLYGTYWVDRPPPMIALVKLSDMVGGPLFARVLAALGCALLVVAAARTAYLISGGTAARWTALGTAAVASNTMIDSVAAKGEILGIPVVVTSFWFALEALRLVRANPRRMPLPAVWLALGAGFLGMLAIGLKQNMATGLTFGGVVLLTSALRKEISRPDFTVLAGAALVGAAIPLTATIGWCLAVGVRLETLWYTVYGFRSHALSVISDEPADAPARRAALLALFFLLTGMAFVVVWFLANIRDAWRAHAAVTAATIACFLVDGAGVVLGGSYWRPYLFGLVPSVTLFVALISGGRERPRRTMQRIVALTAASSLISMVVWVTSTTIGAYPPMAVYTGQAIHDVAEPGDTIVVFGGHADIVLSSGLDSPYEHLWSLPMRGNDPGLDELTGLLRSDEAPTWFVGWVRLDAWNGAGHEQLESVLAERYTRHGTGCDDHPIWLLTSAERPEPAPRCDQPWKWWQGLR
ncbi:MAG: hypothetical protein L0H93_02270 [Nocardioides sp.]|nr:hypothetical protein [Nocardioides sp.]